MAKKPLYDLDQLLGLTKSLFPDRFTGSKEAISRLSKLIYTPFVGTKLLSIRGEVQGSSTDKIYKVIIVFQNVDYSDTKDSKHPLKISVDGRDVYMSPIKKSTSVRFRCSCLDAYFTSLYYAWQSNNLYGVKPRKYVRKTTTYPERNPDHLPILCKHLLSVVTRVRKSRYYTGG